MLKTAEAPRQSVTGRIVQSTFMFLFLCVCMFVGHMRDCVSVVSLCLLPVSVYCLSVSIVCLLCFVLFRIHMEN